MVPALLAAKIGIPVDLLMQCIGDFMEPDPGSRTGDLDGRRLELIDHSSRQWGWRVINHSVYRERARKSAYDRERTESGADAARKREARNSSREVPTRPASDLDAPETAPKTPNTGTDAGTPYSAPNTVNIDVPRSPDASRCGPLSEANTNKEEDAKNPPKVKVPRKPKPPPDESWRQLPSLNHSAFENFLTYKAAKRQDLLPQSVATLAKKLAALPSSVQTELIEMTIANGWQGIQFEKAEKMIAKGDDGWR